MRAVLFFVGLAASGCGFTPSPAGATADSNGSGGSDALPDAPDNVACFGHDAIDMVCLPKPIGTSPITYSSDHAIDTDGEECIAATANGVPVCVIAYTSITIADNVTLSAHGSKPLVLVATDPAGAIDLAGVNAFVDVGSHRSGSPGPGPARQSGTAATCIANATAASGRGGGYGGTYTRTGGGGGIDNTGANAGGPANAQSQPTQLIGGCPGGIGGMNAAPAAEPGGAVALIATTITIDGVVTASGAGGAGATANNGGGNGGGAAGLIVLDYTTLAGTGLVLAQGGGGGEGSGGYAGYDGWDGFDKNNRAMDTYGGGDNSPSGGNGGFGGSRPVATAGSPAYQAGSTAGGGGGGGAAGAFEIIGPAPVSITPAFWPNLN